MPRLPAGLRVSSTKLDLPCYTQGAHSQRMRRTRAPGTRLATEHSRALSGFVMRGLGSGRAWRSEESGARARTRARYAPASTREPLRSRSSRRDRRGPSSAEPVVRRHSRTGRWPASGCRRRDSRAVALPFHDRAARDVRAHPRSWGPSARRSRRVRRWRHLRRALGTAVRQRRAKLPPSGGAAFV